MFTSATKGDVASTALLSSVTGQADLLGAAAYILAHGEYPETAEERRSAVDDVWYKTVEYIHNNVGGPLEFCFLTALVATLRDTRTAHKRARVRQYLFSVQGVLCKCASVCVCGMCECVHVRLRVCLVCTCRVQAVPPVCVRVQYVDPGSGRPHSPTLIAATLSKVRFSPDIAVTIDHQVGHRVCPMCSVVRWKVLLPVRQCAQ